MTLQQTRSHEQPRPVEEPRSRPAASRLRVPNLTEVNFDRLRSGRLERLQTTMRRMDVPVCLLYKPANIRYATGTDMMGVWTAGTFARYCVVPAEGEPILFEYEDSIHVAQRFVNDVRPALYWQFGGSATEQASRKWAGQIAELMRELGLANERLAIDKLDALGFLALQSVGIELVAASPATDAAREVKTPEEVALLKINGAIGDAIMTEFEEAIRPGIHEHELLAALGNSLLRHHGDGLTTRLVSSGQNTNPWMSEAHDKIVMPGDLVGVDTDANGFEGYVIDLSRTFLCGERAAPEQREAYRVAYECVTGMTELVEPGLTFEEFAYAAPRLPEKFREQRYVAMAHQAGLEIEGPGIPYPEDVEENGVVIPDTVIRENMILCLECYAGEVDAPFGVKLEDQVLVTENGCELLCTYPFDEKLLA